MKGLNRKKSYEDFNGDGADSESGSIDDIEGDMLNAKVVDNARVFATLDSIYTKYDRKESREVVNQFQNDKGNFFFQADEANETNNYNMNQNDKYKSKTNN